LSQNLERLAALARLYRPRAEAGQSFELGSVGRWALMAHQVGASAMKKSVHDTMQSAEPLEHVTVTLPKRILDPLSRLAAEDGKTSENGLVVAFLSEKSAAFGGLSSFLPSLAAFDAGQEVKGLIRCFWRLPRPVYDAIESAAAAVLVKTQRQRRAQFDALVARAVLALLDERGIDVPPATTVVTASAAEQRDANVSRATA
jgi:hypothetical protein